MKVRIMAIICKNHFLILRSEKMSLVNFFNEADENKKKLSEVLCNSKTQLYFYDFLFVKHRSKITGDYCGFNSSSAV